MKHTYLFTLELVPLIVGHVYDELPSHLTLMSRFTSTMSPGTMATAVGSLFIGADPITLSFGKTIELGPKKVIAHMVTSAGEQGLHRSLLQLLDGLDVIYQYPDFIGENHKPHVSKREGSHFKVGSKRKVFAAYLIEIVDKKRIIRSRFELGTT